MVALQRDIVTDKPCGIHRTALDSSGNKVDRRMLGRSGGAAIKLTPDEDVLEGIGVAEGIETALSVLQSGFAPMWALGSAGAIERFPLLEGIEALAVWADHDESGLRAARRAFDRWKQAGREVCVRYPDAAGRDYNDRRRCV